MAGRSDLRRAARARRAAFVRENAAVADVVYRNIEALLKVREEFESEKGLQDRVVDRITRFSGSLVSVYLHALVFGGWIVMNLGWVPGISPWDPSPFTMLATIACLEAIFLATFVLISQNRMQALADRRADLDLQVNLLAEHEVTRLIAMVDAIARRLDVSHHHDDEVEQLKKDVAPEVVLDVLEEAEGDRSARTEPTAGAAAPSDAPRGNTD